MKRGTRYGLYAVAALLGLSWVAARAAEAAVDAGADAMRDAVEDAYAALEDDARSIFDAWLSVYTPPLETAAAALNALASVAQSPGAAIADAWTWWRNDYDPEGVTPEDAPSSFGGGSSDGTGAGESF